jgi:hypothetical protein
VSPKNRQSAVLQLESLGVNALRVVLYWRNVAPKPNHRQRPHFNQADPRHYHWGSYDSLIKFVAGQLHWKVLLTVSGPVPRWATPHGEDKWSYPNANDFRQFMQAVGKHYGHIVKLYSIWNEPNQPGFLRPQYTGRHLRHLASPALYRRLFLAGYRGLRTSGRFHGMKVLMGETSAVGVPSQHVPAPLTFLRGVFCLNSHYKRVRHCGRVPADGWAQHPYDNSHGPFGDPPRDDVTMNTMGRLVTALNRSAAAGAVRRHLPVYVTEFGVQTKPNPYVGVSYARQAEFDAIAEEYAWNNPRIVSFSQYLLRDDHPIGRRVVGFQSGLENYRGHHKPSYNGFRLPLTVTRTRNGVRFWGLVRPETLPGNHPRHQPHPNTGPTGPTGPSGPTGSTGATGSSGAHAPVVDPASVLLQFSSNHGRRWRFLRRISVGWNGSWAANGGFVRHRVWRVEWTNSAGQTFHGPPIRAYTRSGKLAR